MIANALTPQECSPQLIVFIQALLHGVYVEEEYKKHITLKEYIKKHKKLPSYLSTRYGAVFLYCDIKSKIDYHEAYKEFLEKNKDDDVILNLYEYLFTDRILNYNLFLQHLPEILSLKRDKLIDLLIEVVEVMK